MKAAQNPAEFTHIFFQKQPNPQLKNNTLKGGKLKLAQILRIQHLKTSKLKQAKTERYAENESQEQEQSPQPKNQEHVRSKFFPERSWSYIDALYRGHSLVIRANKHEMQLQGNYFSRNLQGKMNQYLNVVMESRGGGQQRVKQKKVHPSEEKVAAKKQNYFCRQMKRTFLLRKKNQHSPFKGGNLVLDNLKNAYFQNGTVYASRAYRGAYSGGGVQGSPHSVVNSTTHGLPHGTRYGGDGNQSVLQRRRFESDFSC